MSYGNAPTDPQTGIYLQPTAADVPIAWLLRERYLIWSHEHGGWWRHNRWGYTANILGAGLYDKREAESIVANARRGMAAGARPPEEMHLAADVLGAFLPAPHEHFENFATLLVHRGTP